MKSNVFLSLLLTTTITLCALASQAADRLLLGTPAYGGNGCPAGTASVTLSPDQSTLSILFDQYIVEANRSRTLDRKSCNIAIPVHVPQGYSIALFKVDYRGFMSLPWGAEGRFNVEYFFAGMQGPRFMNVFRGPISDEYLLTDQIATAQLVWSACGADTNLRANSSMLVRTNSRGDNALATVDSADVQAGLIYHIQWRRCR
jgi:hypothetical protein